MCGSLMPRVGGALCVCLCVCVPLVCPYLSVRALCTGTCAGELLGGKRTSEVETMVLVF